MFKKARKAGHFKNWVIPSTICACSWSSENFFANSGIMRPGALNTGCFFVTISGGVTMSLTSETLNGGLVRFVFPIDLDVFYVSNMIYLPGMIWPENDPTYWILSVCWYFCAKNWVEALTFYVTTYPCFWKLYKSF